MIKLIIFDLDGVLIDSLKNMEFAWNSACKKKNLVIAFDKYKKLIGLPFLEILKSLKINRKYHSSLKNSYNHFSLKKKKLIKIKEEDFTFLKKLKKNGINLGLFTSKNSSRSKKILGKKIRLFNYFSFPEDTIRGKPYPDGLNKIIKESKIKKSEILYVGDTIFDYQSAKSAKIKYLHANWGYQKTNDKQVNKLLSLKSLKRYLLNEKKI